MFTHCSKQVNLYWGDYGEGRGWGIIHSSPPSNLNYNGAFGSRLDCTFFAGWFSFLSCFVVVGCCFVCVCVCVCVCCCCCCCCWVCVCFFFGGGGVVCCLYCCVFFGGEAASLFTDTGYASLSYGNLLLLTLMTIIVRYIVSVCCVILLFSVFIIQWTDCINYHCTHGLQQLVSCIQYMWSFCMVTQETLVYSLIQRVFVESAQNLTEGHFQAGTEPST